MTGDSIDFGVLAEPTLKRGQVLGAFEVVRPMGSGGQASVYEAKSIATGAPAALKVVNLQALGNLFGDETVQRFRSEAMILVELDHPHIVHVLDVGAHGSFLTLALELIAGPSLQDLIERARVKRQPIAPAEAASLSLELLSALHYLEPMEIYHRDIKPSNVLVDKVLRQAHLADFGLARIKDMVRITAEGKAVGTLQYMSPEQVRARDVDHRSDLYQVGLVLYEMLYGRLPYAEESVYSAALRRASRGFDLPEGGLPEEAVGLESIIRRACAVDPVDRYPSARAMADALLQAAAPLGTAVRRPAVVVPPAELVARMTAFREPCPSPRGDGTMQ